MVVFQRVAHVETVKPGRSSEQRGGWSRSIQRQRVNDNISKLTIGDMTQAERETRRLERGHKVPSPAE